MIETIKNMDGTDYTTTIPGIEVDERVSMLISLLSSTILQLSINRKTAKRYAAEIDDFLIRDGHGECAIISKVVEATEDIVPNLYASAKAKGKDVN